MENKIIIGFILHFIGDYVLQNSWMAKKKTERNDVAVLHASIYSIPFIWLCPSPLWFVIYVSHFFIDRFRLANLWVTLVNWNWKRDNQHLINQPAYLSVWVMIVIDNTFHIIINTICITLAHQS